MSMTRKELRELDCSNLSIDWKNWKRDFLVYMIANDKNELEETKKISTFLWLVGTKGANIYNTLYPNDGSEESLLGTVLTTRHVEAREEVEAHEVIEVASQRTLNEVLKKFDQHCLPQKNVTMESYKFNNLTQKERQTFGEFLTELRTQLERCEFNCVCGASYEDRMLRDRIITGVFDKKLQLKLLDGRNETLTRIIDLCKTFESAHVNKEILDSKKQIVAAVAIANNEPELTVNAVNKRFCFNCGGEWNPEHKSKCPAKEFTCRCGKKGHFFRMCRGKNKKSENKLETKSTGNANGQISTVNWNNMGKVKLKSNTLEFTLSNNRTYRLNSVGKKLKQWTKAYQVESLVIKFKLDTGADVNCIPLSIIKKLKMEISNENNDFYVFDYSNNKVNIFGIVKLKLMDLQTNVEKISYFFVVEDTFEPILGLEACISFGLIKRVDVGSITLTDSVEQFINKYSDIFNGLGKYPGKITIHLKEDAKPVVHYKKRFPNSIVKRLKPKLDEMVKEGIISPVSHPTDWVNNLQIVEKLNGDLRICLDPKPLNACIKREHFLIPTMDNFASELCNKKIFTVIDCSNGFWQIELDDKSAELTTFMTPFGRYKFNRLAFGLNCAPEIFQRIMVLVFGDIPGVLVYFDDIAIVATDESEHDKILQTVIERARLYNIKFNSKKIQYRKSQVKFMGHIIFDGKIKPDEKYKNAILEMKKPKDKQGVMRFLGMLKYLAKFIPNLSKITAELRELTKKDVPFEWNKKHDSEVNNLLKLITSEPILKAYDPGKPVIIQTDASKDGLGSVLIQEGHPIAFASRTLSKPEQKWAQIEKELLAIVFACERFHYLIYGREITVESDHKPLETLNKRDIDDVTPRLQRMFMSLLKYPKLKIIFKPGKNMLVADCLSRAQLEEVSELPELSGVIHEITKSVCLSVENYNYYKKLIQADEKYKQICEFIENGWPGYHHLNDLSKQFHKLKSELHFENGLLFLNHRLVIPTELQRKIAKWLHEPHLGIEKTLARARMLYYWPGMNSQIKEMIVSCKVCDKFKRNNQKEELVQEQNPEYPFQTVSMDIFEYAGHDFIAIMDAYSNYLASARLNNKTSQHIISVISRIFNIIGFPARIRCDNSPFNSAGFEKFANDSNIIFTYSSPHYPQSNGLAEKGVAIAKNILKRCYEANEVDKFQYRILEYNTTPVANMKLTPSELFFGRLVKTKIPVSEQLLIRNRVSEQIVQQKINNKKEKQKYYYDRGAKSLPSLQVDDLVIFKKNGKEWHYGTIVGIVNDRSYIIKDSFENHFRRNRRLIAKTKNNDFNANELFFEENVKSGIFENLPEIQIVKPVTENVMRNNNNLNKNNETLTENVSVNEPELPAGSIIEQNDSLSEYETASSNVSEASGESDNEINIEPVNKDHYVTRSGRIVKPPQRLDW